MKKLIIVLLAACLGIYIVSKVKAKGCSLIPREVLFGNHAKKVQLRISKKGDKLAYCAPVGTVMNIWLRSIDKEDDRSITHDTKRGINTGYWWSYDDSRIFYMQDQEGNENWRLYSVLISDGSVQEYTPFDNVQVRLVEYIKEFPERMLLGINKRDPKSHDVYELNTATGELKLLEENPGRVVEWIADNNLDILGKVESLENGGYKLFVRKTVKDEWREIGTWTPQDEAPNNIYFSKDGNYIFLSDSRSSNTSRFIKIDLRSGEIIQLATDPEYDISGSLFVDQDSLEPLALSYEKDRQNWIFFDAATEDIFSQLALIDQGDIIVGSRTLDNSLWTVAYIKDNGPIAYWLYNIRTQEKKFLFDHQPIFKKYALVHMEPIEFHARDGLLIHGYLTYPCGDKKENLPLIVNVHGGPWSRDAWGFSPEVQWMANRGYAVLQINYRGSTGYGKSFVNAGNKQWSKAMQDDLTDGVDWAIKQGIADPKRIAIYGGSYGGYAALAGATFTPDLYRCAVDLVGPSNVITLIKSIPPYWSAMVEVFYNRVGNPETDEEFLKSISPVNKVDAIKIPILIAQGANDPRVKQAESEQIVEAMKAKGLEYEYLLFPDEGHGFVRQENRLKYYQAVEKFLAKHLGGSYEA